MQHDLEKGRVEKYVNNGSVVEWMALPLFMRTMAVQCKRWQLST